MNRITILGSTGSIGTQTLDIVRENPEMFQISALTAGRNADLLAQQAREFHPQRVVIADESAENRLRGLLSDLDIEIYAGSDAIADTAGMQGADTVVTAMVGYSGLIPTISAINAGKRIALANKETLVVAGQLITGLLRDSEAEIIPVDSEHSAIFQCLRGEHHADMSRIILTASGGPFRNLPAKELEHVTPAQALRHPNWEMGAKVTIDSASMMNKGFEMIEARWLFDCPPEKINIAVHPQSIVHSMVEFSDGSVKAQLGLPDMRTPIGYALAYPDRLIAPSRHMTLADYASLTFEEPDRNKFPLLDLAFRAIGEGGNMPCILNAANEIAVKAFLDSKISFTDMARVAEHTMDRVNFISDITLEHLIETNAEARAVASKFIEEHLITTK